MSSTATSWGKDIATEIVGGVPYRMYTQRPHRVQELLAFIDTWGDRPYVVQGERSLSFADMHKAIAAKAATLLELGVKRGERVFILGWNSPEWIANVWACFAAGAVPVLANAWWSATEIANGLDLIKPVLTLADKRTVDKVPAP